MSKGLVFTGYDGEMVVVASGQGLELILTNQGDDTTTIARWSLGESEIQELSDFLNGSLPQDDSVNTETEDTSKPNSPYNFTFSAPKLNSEDVSRRIGEILTESLKAVKTRW